MILYIEFRVERPSAKRDQQPRNFARAGSFTWTLRPIFDFCPSALGYSTLSLSISVIVNAGTNSSSKNCLLFKRRPDQLCFMGQNLHATSRLARTNVPEDQKKDRKSFCSTGQLNRTGPILFRGSGIFWNGHISIKLRNFFPTFLLLSRIFF